VPQSPQNFSAWWIMAAKKQSIFARQRPFFG
jgi:hypothetical protein